MCFDKLDNDTFLEYLIGLFPTTYKNISYILDRHKKYVLPNIFTPYVIYGYLKVAKVSICTLTWYLCSFEL